MRPSAPYGSWPSPVSPEVLVERSVGLSDLQAVGDGLVWSESRPSEGGREALVSWSPREDPHELLPGQVSARTLVHEYGGRCYAASAGGPVVYSDLADQRLWCLARPGAGPIPLTPAPPGPQAHRYADPVLSPDGRLVVCVRERHGPSVENDLVVVATDPEGEPQPPRPLVGGHDFFAAPRLSPDGSRLAWLSWDHPAMPWDATELWAAPFAEGRLGGARRVAGGPGISVSQPRFAPDGTLHYLSDETGWWNLHAEGAGLLAPFAHDFGGPDWLFGQATYAFLEDGTLVATWVEPSGQRLGVLRGGALTKIPTAFTSLACLQGFGRHLAAIAASPVDPPAVVLLDPATGGHEVLRTSRDLPMGREGIATPEPFSFTAADGEPAHGLFYAPASATHEGPPGERPPLVVTIHGGPTSAARRELSMAVQYWTTRGFAVADVDYRGSTGYGRAYRERLRGAWGVADVDDCADAAAHLAEEGLVDPARMVIRGSSAGGMTVLNCLARRDVFAAGASLYGVADLASLATDTHKFEAHYLDGLVGPWPEAAEAYAERSPLRHAGAIRRPVILFQGTEDKVVPKAQSDAMVAALEAAGVPVTYLVFEGEQHGFRRAETLAAVAAAELGFYRSVLHLGGAEGS